MGHRGGEPTSRAGARSREALRVNDDHYGIREESPKRVDFSKTHQLREVNWDGTYQDSLAYPADLAGSNSAINSTITNSHDIRETDIHFLNFSHIPGASSAAATTTSLASGPVIPSNINVHSSASPPFAPPPSASNSGGNFHLVLAPSSPSSSPPTSSYSTDSVRGYSSQRSPDVRWANQGKTLTKSGAGSTSHSRGGTGKLGSGKSGGSGKWTHVDLQITGSGRIGHSAGHSSEQSSSVEQRHKELLHIRKQVEEKWASSGSSNKLPDKNSIRDSKRTQHKAMEDSSGNKDIREGGGAVGGASAMGGNSPRRPRPMKMSITQDLKEDEIMLKLKERLKQQRAHASTPSVSGSNDTSLADSSGSSAPPPSLPPRQPLTGDSAPGLPMTRKIAAAHPTTSYRGFSDATGEHATTPSRPNTKVSGVKKKGGGPKKPPPLQPKKHDYDSSAKHTPPPPIPERPKKVARVVASGDKKSSKSGAKNIITTSSWRAGQELIMKELGMAPKVKSKSSGQAHESHKGSAGTDGEGAQRNRQPDGAEAGAVGGVGCGSGDVGQGKADPATEQVIASSKALTEDARNMLSELQLGNSENTPKIRSPQRPAVKRKAPKATEPEKHQQPSEKSRHYDQDSIRKFMAKQKAERLKRQQEEKMANQKANEKKQQMLTELVEKQKKQVVKSAALGRGEGDRKRKKDGKNAMGKENLDLGDQDHDDDSTLTGDTGDSTPQATPREEEGASRQRKRSKDNEAGVDFNQHAINATTTINSATTTALSTTSGVNTGSKYIEFKGQMLNFDVNSALNRFSQVVKQRQGQELGSTQGSTTSGARSGSSNPTEFQLQGSHVFATSRNPGMPDTAFALGTSNSTARTNEERKQAIKATALTLQSRLAEERKKLEEMNFGNPSGQQNLSPDFVSRYNRIAGSKNDYAVFTSDLPGSQSASGGGNSRETQDQAAVRIQAAYRGHNVRQALNWEMPSGQTFGQKLRGISQGNKQRNEEDDEDDASELTETSTFSEITATEASDGASPANVPGNRRIHSAKHHRQSERSSHTKPTVATYRPPTQYSWSESKADPYSVMSVFSRQNRYLAAGSRQADMPFTNATTTTSTSIITATTTTTTSTANSAFVANLDLTSLKQPVITSTERVVYGQTSSGQPIIAKARYMRVEGTVSEKADDRSGDDRWHDDDKSDSVSDLASPVLPSKHSYSHQAPVSMRSNDPVSKSEKMARQASEKSGRSENYSMTFESSEDDDPTPTAYNKHSTANKMPPPGYNRQVSDAGLESDVSQMSEDEPRVIRSKHESAAVGSANRNEAQDRPTTFATNAERGRGQDQTDGHLSPNSLANKFSANLNYLESMEESLRQVVGMERTRAVALAQQETVSLAQVLKARQQEHNAELKNLQAQAQQEAREATQQLDNMRSRPAASSLLEKEDNRRPESRSYALSASRSSGRITDGKEDLSQSPGNRRIRRSAATTSLASVTKASTSLRTSRDHSSTNVKTAEDTRNDSDSSIRTASDVDVHDSHTGSIPEDVLEEEDSYSMSFDESVTEVLPSESHRKELRRQSGEFAAASGHDVSASHLTPYNDLSSLFVGEDSFNKFTAEMVRQIMREEEYRAQHQAALLSLREKALKEKAKAELAWLQQLKQKPVNKGADDVFPNIDKREKKIKKNLQEQQAEIRRLQEANKMAAKERQMLLQQHEEIAKIKQNTQQTLIKLKGMPATQGRLARPSEVHTEDEIEEVSDVSEDLKDSKSDSEMFKENSPNKRSKGDKKNIEKQQKLRLDQKYMTAREQKLHEREKHAKELIEWKKRLDEEEQKIYKLERIAMEAWEGKNKEKNKKEETAVKKAPKVSASKKDDSHVISDRMLSSMHDELPSAVAPSRSRGAQGSVSEAISTQISVSKTETSTDKRSRSRSAPENKDKTRSPGASGSESSIPEDVPTGTGEEKQKAQDSSDDTLINSSANDDYADTFEHDGSSSLTHRKKSPVGKLLPHGNSPLPTPWSRKTGSESESEDSISHTETLSDASDYEVRIRQLSDELRRRRKEVEILKKERSKRQKEKLKAQEEALKKQLDAYNNYIQQLKVEKDDLEHESQPLKAAVKPQIKQPRVGNQQKKPTRQGEDVASNSSSFEDMRDGTDSNQTSPSVDGKDVKVSPVDEKAKKKASVSLMDRISEGSESDKSGASGKLRYSKKSSQDVSEKSNSSSVQEAIEEASQLDSVSSGKTASGALKIKTSLPAASDKDKTKATESVKDDDHSYSMDFSDVQSSLAQSHNRVSLSASQDNRNRSDAEISEQIEEAISVKSQSVSSKLAIDVKAGAKVGQDVNEQTPLSPPATGIQESDSETESRVNSYHTSAKSEGSSRPSSERSVGSISYSAEEYEEEEDIISCGSDKAPPSKSSQKLLPAVPGASSAKTDEDISEHISASLPSITEKQRTHSGSLRQESKDLLDSVLGYNEEEHEDEDDKTPVPTPREMGPTPVPDEEEEEENASLLQTDPLADFYLGDRVLVWGRRPGVLRYKGKVEFSPGIWAGVELDAEEGDSDGIHEGKRYFTCPSGHGVMIHGSDIVAASEKPAPDVMAEIGEARSPDESLTTDQEDSNMGDTIDVEKTVLPASDASMLHSTPVSSPHHKGSEKPTATPVKRNVTLVADQITDQLTTSIVEDSIDAMGRISSKQQKHSTVPKSGKKNAESSSPTRKDSPEKLADTSQDQFSPKDKTDITTDGVMKSLLKEAITDMMKIRNKKAGAPGNKIHDTNGPSTLVNGDLDDKDLGSFFDDEDDDDDEDNDKIQDNDSGLSLDPVQRPGSPVPGDSPSMQDHKQLNDDLAGLFGEYIDDDLGFEQMTNSSKPPPPYPGGEQSQALPTERVVPEEIPPVVPHTKEEVAPIISRAVDIFWTNRRYGESLEGVAPPPDFLSDGEDEEAADALTAQSKRSWKHMLFDLTGEIIRDIYKDDDKPNPPVWQKAKHRTQKFFKGVNPPTTVDGLQPVVQAAVFRLLDLNGTRKHQMVNKWNIRKKKDSVDAVLVQELGEEEKGWVDYNDDELNLKMQLAESLFDSLMSETVQTLNGIYQKKQHSQV